MTAGILNATGRPDTHSAWRSELSRASAAQPISRTQELEQLAQANWHIAEVEVSHYAPALKGEARARHWPVIGIGGLVAPRI
jgi:hypothetical protein